MKSRLRLALLLPAATLLGCTLPSSTSDSTQPLTGAWQNWQIQQGSTITSPPTGLYFVGAVQTQASQSAAIFATPGTGQSTPTTLNIVLGFLGTYGPSTGDVVLYPATTGSPAYGIGFTEPSNNTAIPVSIFGGCVYPLNYTGVECNALANLSPAVGVQIANLTGTYTGPLANPLTNVLPGSPATLTLTQTATPNSSGQFPLSGTIVLPGSIGTVPLAGTVSGEGISLNDPSAAPGAPSVGLTGSTNPSGTEINVWINYSGSAGSFPLTGTFTRQ